MPCGPQMVGRTPPGAPPPRRRGAGNGITADRPCLDPQLPPDEQRERDEAGERSLRWLVGLGLLAIVLAALGWLS